MGETLSMTQLGKKFLSIYGSVKLETSYMLLKYNGGTCIG